MALVFPASATTDSATTRLVASQSLFLLVFIRLRGRSRSVVAVLSLSFSLSRACFLLCRVSVARARQKERLPPAARVADSERLWPWPRQQVLPPTVLCFRWNATSRRRFFDSLRSETVAPVQKCPIRKAAVLSESEQDFPLKSKENISVAE